MSTWNIDEYGSDIYGDKQGIRGKGCGEGVEDGEEMVHIFDIR